MKFVEQNHKLEINHQFISFPIFLAYFARIFRIKIKSFKSNGIQEIQAIYKSLKFGLLFLRLYINKKYISWQKNTQKFKWQK